MQLDGRSRPGPALPAILYPGARKFDHTPRRLLVAFFKSPRHFILTCLVDRIEQTEETKAAMNKLIEDAQGKNQYVDEGMTQDLLNAADELDVNFDSMEGKKKAVADFRALVEGKLDLPSNRDPTMELGKLILADTSLSKKEIMQAIIEKFGFAEAKKKQAEDRLEAAEKGCRNDANADLLLAFKECAGVSILCFLFTD